MSIKVVITFWSYTHTHCHVNCREVHCRP